MKQVIKFERVLSSAALVAAAALCGAQYTQVNLVSDGTIPALHTDSNLINAWGMAFSPTGPFWINANGSGKSIVYDRNGSPFPAANPLVVTVPPTSGSAPTGIAFNGLGGFPVSNGTTTASSVFIFVTEDGVISGWNPTVDTTNGVLEVANVVADSNFKGAALAAVDGHPMLFATNFHEGMVDVFDSTWTMVGRFTDTMLPSGYVPFGIASVDGFLVVTFALSDPTGHDDVSGAGHGFVDVFSTHGVLLRRLISHGPLNSPWGIAVAPHSFGEMHDTLLVGNFGDGRINAFNLPSGHFRGPLMEKGHGHHPIVIEGLWALAFGNGHNAGDASKLYFTAGPADESQGLFGFLKFAGHHD